jgi:hypothetical protein
VGPANASAAARSEEKSEEKVGNAASKKPLKCKYLAGSPPIR